MPELVLDHRLSGDSFYALSGAKKDSWFSHIAIEVPGEETSNEWCEPVSDEVYDQLQ